MLFITCLQKVIIVSRYSIRFGKDGCRKRQLNRSIFPNPQEPDHNLYICSSSQTWWQWHRFITGVERSFVVWFLGNRSAMVHTSGLLSIKIALLSVQGLCVYVWPPLISVLERCRRVPYQFSSYLFEMSLN